MGNQPNIKYYIFHLLLINIIIILFHNSVSKNIKRSLINNAREIKIKFSSKGINKYLSDNYFNKKFKPSSISHKKVTVCTEKLSNTCVINDDEKTIILKFDKSINTCEKMFKDLDNIIEVDLSDFDGSKVNNMAHTFNGCTGLEKITFGEMDTSQVQNMEYLFYGCTKLKSLDLSNFETSSVTNMKYMFSNMKELTSIDLSNFSTLKVEDMSYMFAYSKSLNFLDISKFSTKSVKTIVGMLSKCYALHYLNISGFILGNSVKISDVFKSGNNTLKICIDVEKTKNYLLSSYKDRIICSETCMNKDNIYIEKGKNEENKKCVNKCNQDLFMYDIFCYIECPQSTFPQSSTCQPKCQSSDEICTKNTPEGYYFDTNDKLYKNCFENCKSCYGQGNIDNNNCKECQSNLILINDSENIYNCYEICPNYYYFDEEKNYICTDKCKDNYSKTIIQKMRCIDKCSNDNKYKYEFNNGFCFEKCPNGTIYNETKDICEINSTKSALKSNDFMITNFQKSITDGNLNNIIENIIDEGKDYIVSNEQTIYQMTTTDNQKRNQNNASTIDFGDCENILKEKYGIDDSIPLIILKVDYFIPGTLIPVIGYEAYHPLNKSKLNLSYCNNTINLNIPVQIDENKIYQYDPNNEYYQDKCSSYTSDNGTDILLYDRKKEYKNNNYSLCEANCYYQGYEANSKQSICNCKIKNNLEYQSDITNNPNTLFQDFNISENDLGYTNVFSCTKNLFTINGILKNMSSYILIISLLFFVATSLFFRRRGYHI